MIPNRIRLSDFGGKAVSVSSADGALARKEEKLRQKRAVMAERRTRPHHVYLLSIPRLKVLKVGMSRDLEHRMHGIRGSAIEVCLQLQRRERILLLGAIEEQDWTHARAAEGAICEALRVHLAYGREWFHDVEPVRVQFAELVDDYEREGIPILRGGT